jgi:hypothetical protein
MIKLVFTTIELAVKIVKSTVEAIEHIGKLAITKSIAFIDNRIIKPIRNSKLSKKSNREKINNLKKKASDLGKGTVSLEGGADSLREKTTYLGEGADNLGQTIDSPEQEASQMVELFSLIEAFSSLETIDNLDNPAKNGEDVGKEQNCDEEEVEE